MLNEIKGWGGGEVLTLDLTRALLKKGVRVTLGVNRDSVLGRQAETAGLPVVSFPMKSEMDIFAVIYLAGLVKRDGYDLIHCHTMRDHVLAGMACRCLGNTHLIRTQHIHYPENPSILAQLAYRKWTQVIVCNSGFIQRDLERAGLDPRILETVHNGICVDRMDVPSDGEKIREEVGAEKGNIIIGCAGSLFATKGQEYLIRAFKGILARYPTARLLFAGDGPEMERLDNLCAQISVSERTHFLGRRMDMPAVIKAMNVMVFPSVWGEPFGLVPLEAMYLGVPVVASRVGGIPEIITDEENGLLVSPRSAQEIEEAVIRILDNADLRERLVNRGKEKMLSRFSAGRMADEIADIYERIMSGR